VATIKMIPEEEATGRVKAVYDEIKAALGIELRSEPLQGHGPQAGIP